MQAMPVSDKSIKDFQKAVTALNKVISTCKKEQPGCFAYLDGNDSLHLLDGTKSIGDVGDQETIIVSANLNAGGGDW
ncbi:MAG: hypothetical protein ACTS9Y_00595 [Methylophilus sp.]|uniref:hypothetical protein n=1 Tax=Methylophilus sp. TaxID=29541 RepID=UPI003FA03172